MKAEFKYLAAIIVCIAAGVGVYELLPRLSSGPAESPAIATTVEATPTPSHYPVPDAAENSGQDISQSSETYAESLASSLLELFGKARFEQFVESGDSIRNFVVTIDNLTNSKLPLQYLPIKGPGQDFKVVGEGDRPSSSPENEKRYVPYVELAESINLDLAIKIYERFYPMLQKSYVALGKEKYFNDRLIEVIDNVLEAPVIKEPIQLSRVSVIYQFVDPDLEARPIGQKILLRMGAENEEKAKAFLRTLRQRLVNLNHQG